MKKASAQILCPICRSKAILLWRSNNFSLVQFPVKPPCTFDSKMPLQLFYCEACMHGFISPRPSSKKMNEFYKHAYDYYTSPVRSGGLTQQLSDGPIEKISKAIQNLFGTKKVKIVEVGGNDGYVLKKLENLSESIVLLEPNQKAASIARDQGIFVVEDFLSTQTAQKFSGQFDVVITRHVIEHIVQPKKFFKNLVTLLKPDGLLCIETPSFELLLERQLLRVISLQHFHYFSSQSLVLTGKKYAELILLQEVEKYAHLAFFKKGENKKNLPFLNNSQKQQLVTSFKGNFEKKTCQLKNKIQSLHENGKAVWLWGAGSAANEIEHVYGIDSTYFKGIIDSDATKQHLVLPGIPKLKILTPKDAFSIGVDCVLVSTYSVAEVCSKIHSIDPNVIVMSLYD